MNCPRCGTDNFPDARYCRECGVDLEVSSGGQEGFLPGLTDPASAPQDEPGSADSPPPADHLLWVFPTSGRVSAAPLIVDDVAFFGSRDRNMYALDLESRTLRWRFGVDGKINAAAALDGGTLFFGCDDYSLYAVDAVTGANHWYFTTAGRITATPVIAAGLVLFGSHDGDFYAIDADSGEERWRVPTGSNITAACALAAGLVYFSNRIGMIVAARLADGVVVHDIRDYDKPTAPVAAGDIIAFGSSNGLHGIEAATAREAWHYETFVPVRKPPAAAGDRILFEAGDYLYATAAREGTLLWQYLLESPLRADPALNAGMACLADEDGLVSVITLASGLKQMDLAPGCPLDGIGAPAAAGDTILLGCGDQLLGIEIGNAAVAGSAASPAGAGGGVEVIGTSIGNSYAGPPGYSNAQAVWHLYPLMVIGGVWQFFWFYRNWKYMGLVDGRNYRPGFRMIGLLSPYIFSFIMGMVLVASGPDVNAGMLDTLLFGVTAFSLLNLYLMYDQLKDIRDRARSARLPAFSLVIVVSGFFSFRNLPYFINQNWGTLFGEPGLNTTLLLMLLGTACAGISVFFLTRAQRVNNELWQLRNPAGVIRREFTSAEVALMLVFGFLQVVGLIGILLNIGRN